MTPRQRLLILAFSNSVGFSATTALALWITTIDQLLTVPTWWGSLVGSLQLAFAALANLIAPYLFRNLTCEQLVRVSAFAAMISGAVMALSMNPWLFAVAAIGLGVSFGLMLSGSNALLARSHSVQGAYATAQICEVAFAASFYFLAGIIIAAFGLRSVFVTLSLLGLAVMGLIHLLALREKSPRDAPGTSPAGSFDWRIPVAAAAFIVFFVGQSAFYQHQVAIGNLLGIEHVAMSRIMTIATIGGLSGAVASKLIGMRFGVMAPVIVTTAVLSCVLILAPATNDKIIFAACAVSVQALTMATVPYLFTLLAKLDATGRFPSRGPALLLIGVAGGPLLAEFFLGLGGYKIGGLAGAALVLVSGGLFVLAARYTGKVQKLAAAEMVVPPS